MKGSALLYLVTFIIAQPTLPASIAPGSQGPARLAVGKEVGTVISGLTSDIPGLMEKAQIPGLQVALIRDGRVAWEQGFGVKSSATGEPVTEGTIFEAASLTKPFFAYAVMKMVDEGLIDLDTPLHSVLPIEMIEAELGHSLDAEGFHRDWFERITPRHILSHSAGTPHGEGGETYPLFFEPGTRWKYSAGGYYFLQLVVEHLKGQPLETVLEEYILDPLGMKRSCMVWRDEYEKTMASGHDAFGNPQDFRRRRRAHAAATLYTTAGEYALFVCAVLNGEGLTDETHREMLASYITMNDEWNLEWSLGFGLQTDGNGRAIWQWGDYGIFRNYAIAYPEHAIGVVYLTNSFNGLSICGDLVARAVGGRALGNEALEYMPYDSPLYALFRDINENGSDVARKRVPELMKQDPEHATPQRVRAIGALFEEQEMFAEAIAIYESILAERPSSGQAMFDLARTHLGAGDRGRARELYRKSLDAPEDTVAASAVEWAIDYIKALEEPVRLDEAYLLKLAGDYETRHLTVRDGALHYFRENVGREEPRPLFAISRDTFVIEGIVYFKLKIEFDERGNPVKLVGLYDSGNRDESVRSE